MLNIFRGGAPWPQGRDSAGDDGTQTPHLQYGGVRGGGGGGGGSAAVVSLPSPSGGDVPRPQSRGKSVGGSDSVATAG